MLLFLQQLRKARLGKIFTFSQEGQSFFKKHLPKASVHVLPTPIDTERFVPKPVQFNGTLRILMNARYATYKRHADLLHALLTVREKGRPFKVTFIGRSDKGRERVASTVRKLGLSDEVTFLEPVPRNSLQDLYGSHDVLVLPSYNEAIGMVIPEAMACGVPTITSDTVGANVYVEDGKTGFVFATGDVPTLATVLLQCYAPHILERMGKEARARIENFSVAAMTERFFREL
jgi:glycosyltransferase involved in cell wall biosynthesis